MKKSELKVLIKECIQEIKLNEGKFSDYDDAAQHIVDNWSKIAKTDFNTAERDKDVTSKKAQKNIAVWIKKNVGPVDSDWMEDFYEYIGELIYHFGDIPG